jgi:hypothetical protein
MGRTRGWWCVVVLYAGCSRSEIDRDLDRGEQVAERVQDGVQTAKRELQRVKEKLPPPEKVKAELAEAKRNLELKLKVAREQLERARQE